MEIRNPTKEPRLVEDWELSFSNGSALAVSLEEALGDTHILLENSIEFHLSEKPSLVNPDDVLAAEDIYISRASLNWARKRIRLVEDPSIEEKEEWQRILNELADPDSLKH